MPQAAVERPTRADQKPRPWWAPAGRLLQRVPHKYRHTHLRRPRHSWPPWPATPAVPRAGRGRL
eukprot:1371396-Lingulodinium_polyedra.AAC.1